MNTHANIEIALEMAWEAAQAIRQLEAAAMEALGKGDTALHRENMMEKCEILQDLPDKADPYLDGADELTGKLQKGLAGFARKAGQALDLESIFYMSALLYPEDYQEGEVNDLERFLGEFPEG
jgi:hypothetical protein